MSKYHARWYTRLFSDPQVVEDLLRSFVHEDFVQLPDFKIAITEIPKRDLVKIRNAVATVFYVENSTPEDIAKNRKELVSLLSAVFREEGAHLAQTIVERINRTRKIPRSSSTIRTINDLTDVSSMYETAVKEHDSKVKVEAERQILVNQLEIRFGLPAQARKRVARTSDSRKIQRALNTVITASSRQEVLKCLD